MKKEKYVITLTRPEGATVADTTRYIRDAVETMGGCLEPPNEDNQWQGDPFFGGVDCTVKRAAK